MVRQRMQRSMAEEERPWGSDLRHVWDVLNRDISLDALEFLHRSVFATREIDTTAKAIVFGFDTNAIYRLGLGSQGDDNLDYLRTRHAGPIIVPGQTLQEVWNNQLAGIQPLAKTLHTKLQELGTEIEKLDQRFGATGEAAKNAIAALLAEYGELFDERAQASFQTTLELLMLKAVVPYVPRLEFQALAHVRNTTKTPPGFRDSGDGDFFVWADFLYGLKQLDTDSLDAVVFVTNDKKPDWSRGGLAHPILAAEVFAIAPKPFELWTLSQLGEYVRCAA